MDLPSLCPRPASGRLSRSGIRRGAAALALLFSAWSGSALAQSVFFEQSFVSGESGNTLEFIVLTFDESESPADGGSFDFSIGGEFCKDRMFLSSQPAGPSVDGVTPGSVTSLQQDECRISLEWDHDGDPLTPAIVPTAPLEAYFYPVLSLELSSGPAAGSVLPVGSRPQYQLLIRDNGFPVAAEEAYIEVLMEAPFKGWFGGGCGAPHYLTNSQGNATFDFGLEDGLLPLLDTGYAFTIQAHPFSGCRGAAPRGARPQGFVVPSVNLDFLALPVEFNVLSQPSVAIVGQPAQFEVRMQAAALVPRGAIVAGAGSPFPGNLIDWQASPQSSFAVPAGGFTTDGDGRGVVTLTATAPDIDGGSLSLSWERPDGFGPIGTNISFGIAQLGLAPFGPDDNAYFTDEVAPGFSVFAFIDSGNGQDPAPGVEITVTIPNQDAVFLPSGLTQAVLVTNADGFVQTPDVRIGRTNQNVQIAIDGGDHGTAGGTYVVTPSTYYLSPVQPTDGNVSIALGGSTDLIVGLLRDGSSIGSPLGEGEVVTWSVAPNDGSALASPTLSDPAGQTLSQFTPLAGGSYTVTASFDSGIPGAPVATQAFVVDVTGAAGLAVSKVYSLVQDGGEPGVADAGDLIEYLVSIQNTGDISLTVLSVQDSIQGGAATPLTGCPAELPPGGSGACDAYVYEVTAADVQSGGSISNNVEVTAESATGEPLAGSASVLVPLGAAPALTLSILSPTNGTAIIAPDQVIALRVLAESGGAPVDDGTTVGFNILSGPAGGVLSAAEAPTSAGVAEVGFSASTPGVYAIEAALGGAFANFSIEVSAVVRSLTKPAEGSGDQQVGATGTRLPLPLLVFARDGADPAPAVRVNWTVSGNAQLSATQTTTFVDGSASIEVTLGNTPGTITVTATREDAPTAQASFLLTAVSRSLVAISGSAQTGAPGTTLPQALVVEAQDGGMAQPGVAVEWSVVGGAASLSSSVSTTDGDGRSAVIVTLGESEGPVEVLARRQDAPAATARFALTSQAGAPQPGDSLVIVSGANQPSGTGQDGEPLVVRFLRDGVPVDGITVAWEVIEGSVTLQPTASVTNADGLASTLPRFGTTTGPVRVQASAGQATPVTFLFQSGTLQFVLLEGNAQSGPFGTRAAFPLVVGLFGGSEDLPIVNATITWEVIGGDATLDQASGITDAEGRASNGLRFGAPGPITVRASAFNGQRVLDFTATSYMPDLFAVSGDGQTGPVGEPLAEDFVVRIAQPANKSLAGVTVQWQVMEGGGSLSAVSSTTDANGLASVRLALGPSPGLNRVSAGLQGGGSVVFSATGTQVAAGQLVVISGSGQNLPTSSDSAPLVVELRDGNGNPLPNRSLVWSADNAELAQTSTITNAQGRAQNVARVIIPGSATVQVAVEGGSLTASFALNGGIANIPSLSPGQRRVGAALDDACALLAALSSASLSPEQADLLARCLELAGNSGENPGAVRDALNELSNDIGNAQVNAAFDALRGQYGNIQRRLADRRREGSGGVDVAGLGLQTGTGTLSLGLLGTGDDGNPETGADFGRWSFFASGILGSGRQDPTQASRGFKFETRGLTAGVDYRVNPQVFVGAAIGYNRQDSDFRSGRGEMDTSGWSLTGYGSWYSEKDWYLDGVLTWGRNDYDITRRIRYEIPALGGGTTRVDQLARGSTSGDLRSLSLSGGRDFQRGAWNLGSYLRGSLASADIDAYSERISGTGPGTGLGLRVDSRSFDSRTMTLGGRASYTASMDWGILTPNLQLEFEREFKDDAQRIVSRFLHDPGRTAMGLEGDPLDNSYFNVGVGLAAILPGGKSAYVFYERLMGRSGQSQGTLSLGVRIEF
jgi:outer membrane autotransporter protein/uncharacterized repeat protein (TIGR01451 family)